MADMTGLAYLMSLIGGGAKGGYQGYSEGIGDQQKAAQLDLQKDQLAERQRQFDEGQFTDITPEMGTKLGMPAGRTRNTLIPSLLTASEKAASRAEAQKKQDAAASAYEQAAKDFGSPEIANPEAAGTGGQVVTPAQPDPFMSLMARLQRGGSEKDTTPALVQWLRNQNPNTGMAGNSVNFDIGMDDQGNIVKFATPYNRRTGVVQPSQVVPPPPGTENLGNRSATDQAANRLSKNPSVPNAQRLDAITPPSVIPQGSIGVPRSTAVYGGPGAAPGGAPGAKPATQGSNLDKVTDPGSYIDFTPQIQRGPGGTMYNPIALDPGMRREYSAGLYSVDALREVARDLRTLAPDEQSRLSLYFRTALQSTTPISIFQFLSPAEARTRTTLQHIQLRYEQAMGGARMAGSIQMYPVMQKFLGGVEGFITPEITEDLANNMAGYLQTVMGVEKSQGIRTPPPPQAKTPTPPTVPAPRPGGFMEWKRSQGGR